MQLRACYEKYTELKEQQLKKSVEITSDKFDIKNIYIYINSWQCEISCLKERIDEKSDDSEQYSHRNPLLEHGVEE